MSIDQRPTRFLLEHHILPGVRDEIHELGLFLESTETFLQSLHDQKLLEFIAEHHRRGVQNLPDGTSLGDFFDENYDAWPEGRLTRRLRNSFVVGFYSLIEWSLLDICHSLRRKGVRIAARDIRGDNEIDRAKTYIVKVLCTQFPSASAEWAEIQLCRRVRNCIVHSAGEVASDSQNRRPIEDYARAHPDLLQLQGDRIRLERAYCERVTGVARTFFESLGQLLLAFAVQNESSLELVEDTFGEFYIGRELGVLYVPPPPDFDANASS